MRILYFITRLLSLVAFRLFRYRQKIILKNLQIVFPDQPPSFHRKTKRAFEKYFSEILAETLKSFSISRKELRKRYRIEVSSEIKQDLKDGKDVFIASAHLYNWEWAGIAFGDQFPARCVGIYKPLSEKIIDQLLKQVREKQGTQMIPMAQVARDIMNRSHEPTAYLFLSDQSTPFVDTAHWIPFFGIETPFVPGMSTFAVKKNIPIYYFHCRREKRGHYRGSFELLVRDPENNSPEEITSLYGKKLEENILNEPVGWLWSHKRWKRVLQY